MVTRTKKTVFVYTLLIMSSLSGSLAQQFNKVPTSGFVQQTATSFGTPGTYPLNSFGNKVGTSNNYPQNSFGAASRFPVNSIAPSGMSYPVGKGYYPMPSSSMMSYPMHSNYWTGHATPYGQYPQYQPHYQSGYPQQYNSYPQMYQSYPQQYYSQQYYPQQYYPQQYYPQTYGFNHQQSGYSMQYGQYPSFDSSYWTSPINHPSYYHGFQQPVYHAPVYHPGMHNGYPYHPAGPYYKKPSLFNRGYLGGTGRGLTKGHLGALLAGVVVGSIVKKG